eukprot:9612197-Alexandrium_andersonii.AAC.1
MSRMGCRGGRGQLDQLLTVPVQEVQDEGGWVSTGAPDVVADGVAIESHCTRMRGTERWRARRP